MARNLAAKTAAMELNYQVPANNGGFIPADPIKFCLKYKPPTIAIVYQLLTKPRKYVHEIRVELYSSSDLHKVCDELFVKEKHYFNPQKISRSQVLELLKKLHTEQFPPMSNKENKAKVDEKKATPYERKQVDYPIEEHNNKKTDQNKVLDKVTDKKAPSNNMLDDLEDLEDDGNWNFNQQKKKAEPASKEMSKPVDQNNKPKSNPFDNKVKGAFDDLDDIEFAIDPKKDKKESSSPKNKATNDVKKDKKETDNGLFVDNDFGDDFEDEYEDDFFQDNKNKSDEDIFEKSRSKEQKQTQLENKKQAEIKQEEALKNEIKASGTLQHDTEEEEEDEELDQEDQVKMINDQFQMIYDNDPQLREVLNNNISELSLEEKYQIMTAYMNGGGVQGLLEEEGAERGRDSQLDKEEEKMIEDEFTHIYMADAKLRELLGADPSTLNIKEKYQILMAYKKGGGVQGLLGDEEDEESVLEHDGKKFKRVQIEGENQDFLMDEEGNIYDTEFNFIGQANEDDA